MAETSGHQSTLVTSSSVAEKGGSCAELHPKHPSPESPGSPFEMIANSSGFEFKECEEKAINHGLSQISTLRPLHYQSPEGDEPYLVGYKFSMQSVGTHRPEDFEPGHLSTMGAPFKSSGHKVEFLHKGVEEICKPSKNESSADHNLDFCVDLGSVKNEESSYESKADLRWPDAEEDLDSSGESDDTVIDAGWRVKTTVTDQREHAEDGWVELSDTRQGNEASREDSKSESAIVGSKTLPLNDRVSEKLDRAISKTPDSPHSEGFVDLVETGVTDPPTGATYSSESLEDKVQESLTIEALKALAAGVQDWNSESRDSSPEILSPQGTNFEELKERPSPAERDLQSTAGIASVKGKEELLSNAPLA
ncbi:reticulon-3 isoform X1 [Leptodactylus fuscus]|uniref:reticulon-3 isoform X1 n=1 Tax=Leptodactylus fuscus TaxID=238119 RepID=UPI003F4E9B8A